MSPPTQHAWSWTYLKLKFWALAIRSITNPVFFVSLRLRGIPYPGVKRTFINVPSREKGRAIKVHRYERTDSAGKGGKKAVHLNWHGSGFVIPSLGTDAEFCSRLAHDLDVIVYDGDYRKAPEHPFPAALEDVEDLIHWAHSQPSIHDTQRVSISGFSAGANLALSASWQLGKDLISSVVAFYPPTDFLPRSKPKSAPVKHSAALSPNVARFFDACYLIEGADRRDPRVSNVLADPSSYPDVVYITCADGDTLYGDGVALIDKLQKAGHKDATFFHVDNEGHAFDKGPLRKEEARKWTEKTYADSVEAVRRGWKVRESKL